MKPLNSLDVRGKIGNFVYQRVDPRFANVPDDPKGTLQKRIHVATLTSNTPGQQANRLKFQAAVAAYRLLTPEEIQSIKKVASKKGITAYNLFISQWLRTH